MWWYGNSYELDNDLVENVASLNESSSLSEWLAVTNDLLSREVPERHIQYLNHTIPGIAGYRGFPSSRWTFLHHIAYYNAPDEIYELVGSFPKSLPDGEDKLAWQNVTETDPVRRQKLQERLKPDYKVLFQLDQKRVIGKWV